MSRIRTQKKNLQLDILAVRHSSCSWVAVLEGQSDARVAGQAVFLNTETNSSFATCVDLTLDNVELLFLIIGVAFGQLDTLLSVTCQT